MAGNESGAAAKPTGIHHVRLTVTDVERSKDFYQKVFGLAPIADFSDDKEAREDPGRLYGGCVFMVGQQLLGLRPVAEVGDRFQSTRVGLDHLSLSVGSPDDLRAAVGRLDAFGVEHGAPTDLPGFGIAVLSLQDTDDINLELVASL